MTKRYLIINCDDFGQCRAANEAIIHLLEAGKVSSATIMPPAPAFAEAAAWARGQGDPKVGLHLTFTSEYEGKRWKSLTGAPSLHDERGYMHMTVKDVEVKTKSQDVRAEIRAQFRAVREAGVMITHVDNHMGSLYGMATGRSYLPLVLRECGKRGLPFRIFRKIHEKDEFLASIPNAANILAKIVALADVLGVAMPDYLLTHKYHVEEGETYESFKRMLIQKVYDLPEGVSETYIHPAVEDAELKSFLPSWQKRVWEFELMQDEDFVYAIKDAGVVLTDYRYVRDHLRHSRLWAVPQLLKALLR